jgi:hypothetical protein
MSGRPRQRAFGGLSRLEAVTRRPIIHAERCCGASDAFVAHAPNHDRLRCRAPSARKGKGVFRRESAFEAVRDCKPRYSNGGASLQHRRISSAVDRHGLSNPPRFARFGGPSVRDLNGGRGPTAIARLVVAIHVDPVDRMVERWTRPHVLVKVSKRAPALTNADPATAVVAVVLPVWIAAATAHFAPAPIRRIGASPHASQLAESLFVLNYNPFRGEGS